MDRKILRQLSMVPLQTFRGLHKMQILVMCYQTDGAVFQDHSKRAIDFPPKAAATLLYNAATTAPSCEGFIIPR